MVMPSLPLQDKYHLYFLFDLMAGGDLMDVLVAEAKVIKRRIPQGIFRQACFAPKVPPAPLPAHPTPHSLLRPAHTVLLPKGFLSQGQSPSCPTRIWRAAP